MGLKARTAALRAQHEAAAKAAKAQANREAVERVAGAK